MECTFNIPGVPVGKARPRVTRTGHAYTPEKTVLYENWVKECFLNQCPEWKAGDQECRVVIVAEFSVPKSISKKKRDDMLRHAINPTKKPDLDNIVKSVLDALNGIAYTDDSHVTSLHIKKIYSDDPKVTVTICKEE